VSPAAMYPATLATLSMMSSSEPFFVGVGVRFSSCDRVMGTLNRATGINFRTVCNCMSGRKVNCAGRMDSGNGLMPRFTVGERVCCLPV